MRKIIGRIKMEIGRVVVGDPMAFHRDWQNRTYVPRAINDRSLSVCGCIAATQANAPGGILGTQDPTGGEAAVVKLDGEQAEVAVTYDPNGQATKIEITVIR
jgi:hypothetical protein